MKTNRKPDHLYRVEITGGSNNQYWIDLKTTHPEIVVVSDKREYFQYEKDRDESKCLEIIDHTVGTMNNAIKMNELQEKIALALLGIEIENSKQKLIERVYFANDGIHVVLKHIRRVNKDLELIEIAISPFVTCYHNPSIVS